MVSADGSWTVAEIELVRRFREAQWQAFWVDTYGKAPREWAQWIIKPELRDSLPEPLGSKYRDITNAVNVRGKGRPDIIAWPRESVARVVLVESEMRDRISYDQENWFRRALQAGFSRDQLAIAKWHESKLRPAPFQ
jgi:hypothetical protein